MENEMEAVTVPRTKYSRVLSYVDAVVELASSVPLGELLEFSRLSAQLGLSSSADDRSPIRSAVAAAKPRLIKDYGRVLIAQRGRGYRVALPGELAGAAEHHRHRGDRQVRRALAIVTHADTSAMTPQEYQRFEATRVIISGVYARMNAMDARLERLEEAIFGVPATGTSVVSGEVTEKRDNSVVTSSLPVEITPSGASYSQNLPVARTAERGRSL